MFANAAVAFSIVVSALAATASEPAFQRDAVVKALGYDPEAPVNLCKTNMHHPAAAAIIGNAPSDADVVRSLRASGELGAERVACPDAAAREELVPFVKPGARLTALVCIAAAEGAGGKITVHISEMMNAEHPDVVAGYVDGVVQALVPLGDACKSAGDAVWAKVAAQAALFENRARAIREGRVCALWRIAVDKEVKEATATGENKGRAAGLARLQLHGGAALSGAHHYCDGDASAGFIDANFDLTKMLIESMPEK